MSNKKKKILLAVDGSGQSLNAVHYAGATFSTNNSEIVLFNILAGTPETFLDLGKEAVFQSDVAAIGAWTTQVKQNIEQFMQNAKSVLTDAGFQADDIKIKIHMKKSGVTRDILEEADKGYDALVVGRTGISKAKDILIGGIANKLIGKTAHPIVVVGGKPTPKRILIAFDGSKGSKRAVDCIASLVDRSGCRIRLCHVVRRLNFRLGSKVFFTPKQITEWLDEHTKEIRPVLKEMEKRLIKSGFSKEFIDIEILDEQISRAYRIVSEARDCNYQTIVVGRRGLTIVEEFLMGRVSNKVLQMATEMAVWIA